MDTQTSPEQSARGETAPSPSNQQAAAAPGVSRTAGLGVRARAAAAVVAGRASGAVARRMRVGAGTSLPGLVARRVDPAIVRHLSAQLRHGSLVITGTNGKTTTSGLTAYVLRGHGLRVWRNREGANLMRGVTAALVIRARPNGRLRWQGNAAAVFEVDEAAFPQVVAELQPRVVVVTNLFRDQLDRYGEVDTVVERWRQALSRLPDATRLVLNADDPAVAALADSLPAASALYFGVEDAPAEREAGAEVLDTRTCPRCRQPLRFAMRFYSHLGHWSCPACGYRRPEPLVHARAVSLSGLDGSAFTLQTPAGAQDVRVPLPGLYNVYNALAAAAAGVALGADGSATGQALGRFTAAFGRAERLLVRGRDVRLLLAKNPTGLNEVLRAIAGTGVPPHLLVLLNDHAADGEDVSWIWDADFEQVARLHPAGLTASGTRCYDLALRLKYAGSPPQRIEPDIARALDAAVAATPEGSTLFVVPTYTAMLAVRGELERQGFAPHYWEQRDA
jgi:UDP-N-acetylmuramyl tripeptide synthase